MPNLKVVDMAGREVGSVELSDSVFAAEPNGAVLHAYVRTYLMNQRQGTQSTLTRSEVSGGGKKPWKQKGTGRARQGSTRAPQWRHGGVAMGPKPRSYRISMNKKVRRIAMISALSAKVAAGEMIVVDKIETAEFRTKTMVAMLSAIGAAKKALVVLPQADRKVIKSFANIEGVRTAQASNVNAYDILNCDSFIVVESAVKKIEEVYAK